MKKLILLLSLFPLFLNAQVVTDSIHIKHYSIYIDTISYASKTIKGHTYVTVQSKLSGVNNISLSLRKMLVDSISAVGNPLAYTYNDTALCIQAPTPLNVNDTVVLKISYHGKPVTDPTFGGFSFSGSYAFNIGVGFDADPHNMGNVWFPCLDVFDDKAFYDFHITTPPTYKAFCNGTLQSVTTNADGNKVFYWTLEKPIPTYLAAIAVAPYAEVHRNYKGIPMMFASVPTDTAKTKIYFAKIDTAMRVFIDSYGPYPWEKVGYVCVPFNGGAMEHATSIHIGSVFVNSGITYETIGPHELSHMWWGDLVTCKTQEDMWLNEGFASYNERLFTQAAYGQAAYKNSIRTNHRTVLQLTHTPNKDGSYIALNAVPHAYTYGSTVYDKGADIVHTLRNYMGDAKFFKGCKDYMTTHAYGNATSFQLRNALSTSSGIDMTDFFNDWVFTPGFPHFSIDSVISKPASGKFDVSVYTRQRSKGNTHLYKMPVECRFTNGANDTTIIVNINAFTNKHTITLSFNPTWTMLDHDEKISDAISDYEQLITTTGNKAFPETNTSLSVVNTGSTNSIMRIEHNWIAPDSVIGDTSLTVSDYHYWKIDGLLSPGFVGSTIFNYNGSNATTGYIDNTFIIGSENNLVMAYRKGPGYNWTVAPHQTLSMGSATDKVGSIKVDSIKLGEYSLAKKTGLVGISTVTKNNDNRELILSPNPIQLKQNTIINIKLPLLETNTAVLRVLNATGKIIHETTIYKHQAEITWDAYGIATGLYFINLEENGKQSISKKLLIQ